MLTFKEHQVSLKEAVEQLGEVNHREFASKGLMHPEMSKHMKVGSSMDFYARGTGDKISGTVTKNTGKEVHVKADKDGRTATGSTQKFKIASSLDEDYDQIEERADREDDEHGGGPSPRENPDKGWKPNRAKKVKAEVKEASTGNAFDWKSYTSGKKGQGVSGTTKTYHDVKKVSTGTVYTKQYDKDGTSKGSGEDAAKKAEPVEQPKRGRGRPKGVGAKAGNYKPRDPASKAASAAKAAASKAANRKARNEEFNQEFIEELMSMLVENQDVEEFMDLLQEEAFDDFYVSEIEAIEEAVLKIKKDKHGNVMSAKTGPLYKVHTKAFSYGSDFKHDPKHVFKSKEKAEKLATELKRGTNIETKVTMHESVEIEESTSVSRYANFLNK